MTKNVMHPCVENVLVNPWASPHGTMKNGLMNALRFRSTDQKMMTDMACMG